MANTVIQKAMHGLKKINSIAVSLSGGILLFITLAIFVDVFLRYFFNSPSIWITEVSTYLFLYMIFLGTAQALQEGKHIRVTFLLDFFGERLTRGINILTSLFALIFCILLLWQTSIMTWTAFAEHWTSPSMLNAPYGYIYLVMVLGTALLALTFISNIISQLSGEQ